RDQELMLPLVDRVSGPAQRVLVRMGRRVSPSDYADRIRVTMLRAGRLAPGAADRFLALRSLSLLGAPLFALLTLKTLAPLGSVSVLAAGFVAVACVVLPSTRLTRAVDDR